MMEPELPLPEPLPSPPPPAAVLPPVAPSGLDALVLHDPQALAARLAAYTESRTLLLDWLREQLIAGVDYQLIHRKAGPRGQKRDCPQASEAGGLLCETCRARATLAKPGSEKICGLLQLRPRFRRDAECWEMLGGDAGLVALVCELVTATGVVVAEGRGARHRDQDFGDVNKTLKMAQKSAQTDAVLRCAGLSEILTQDLEDMPAQTRDTDPDEAPFAPPRRTASVSGTTPPPPPPPAVPRQPSLSRPLRASVAEAAARNAEATAPGQAPQDAISRPRMARLMALMHQAIDQADVPEDVHEEVFARMQDALRAWVLQTQGRYHVSHCSYRAYDELCAQIPAALEAALTAPTPHAPAGRVIAKRRIVTVRRPVRRPRLH